VLLLHALLLPLNLFRLCQALRDGAGKPCRERLPVDGEQLPDR